MYILTVGPAGIHSVFPMQKIAVQTCWEIIRHHHSVPADVIAAVVAWELAFQTASCKSMACTSGNSLQGMQACTPHKYALMLYSRAFCKRKSDCLYCIRCNTGKCKSSTTIGEAGSTASMHRHVNLQRGQVNRNQGALPSGC